MSDATVLLSEVALARLKELARWGNVTLTDALERAIKDQYDQQFWPATNAAYAALRANESEWAAYKEEMRSLEGTLMDGLDPGEEWQEPAAERPVVPQGEAS